MRPLEQRSSSGDVQDWYLDSEGSIKHGVTDLEYNDGKARIDTGQNKTRLHSPSSTYTGLEAWEGSLPVKGGTKISIGISQSHYIYSKRRLPAFMAFYGGIIAAQGVDRAVHDPCAYSTPYLYD